jgi:hypothetical protein
MAALGADPASFLGNGLLDAELATGGAAIRVYARPCVFP